ncbi:MAG: sensor histidine kinase [Microbacteriaceae bacterium]|nr:sensor histidine kinase [Microbacteriaceae bacterium]
MVSVSEHRDQVSERSQQAGDEFTEHRGSLLWWDLITAATLVVLAIIVFASRFDLGPALAAGAFISLAVLASFYLVLGRTALRLGMRDAAQTASGTVFLVLLVVLVGAASWVYPTLASLQALAYPFIWVIADAYRRAVAWSAALALTVGIGSAIAYGRYEGISPVWQAAVIATVSFVFAVAMGTWITRIVLQGDRYRDLAERLRASQETVAELSAQAGAAGERERLSRELHDTLTQTLTGLVMLSEQAERALAGGDAERAADRVARITEASREAMAEARALVATTQPLGDGGLVQAIDRVADRLRRDTGLTVHCELASLPLDREREVVLLRAAQEGLANARRHARASTVWVTLRQPEGDEMPAVLSAGEEQSPETRRWALLTVADDGVGPEIAAARGEGEGFGLSGLAERVRSAGGVLTFGPQTGGGASLGVWVPQRRAEETSTAERDTEQRSAL